MKDNLNVTVAMRYGGALLYTSHFLRKYHLKSHVSVNGMTHEDQKTHTEAKKVQQKRCFMVTRLLCALFYKWKTWKFDPYRE